MLLFINALIDNDIKISIKGNWRMGDKLFNDHLRNIVKAGQHIFVYLNGY